MMKLVMFRQRYVTARRYIWLWIMILYAFLAFRLQLIKKDIVVNTSTYEQLGYRPRFDGFPFYIYIYIIITIIITIYIYIRYFKIKIAFFLGIHHFQTLKWYTLCIPKPVVLQRTSQVAHAAANQPQMLHDWWVGSNMYNVRPPRYVCWFRFAPVTSSL